MEQATVLLADPDTDLLKNIGQCLRKEGYGVLTALDGQDALCKFKLYNPNLMVLELDLPGIDGLTVCRTIRKSSRIAIIVLSQKAAEIDRISSFKAGADDYLPKPCSNRELLARIKAVMRRVEGNSLQESSMVMRFPGLIIDKFSHQVKTPRGNINLTKKELNLLWFLASNPGKVFSRKEILNQVWGTDELVDLDEVTVMISRLRDKIESNAQDPRYITTVWGVGYKFEPKTDL